MRFDSERTDSADFSDPPTPPLRRRIRLDTRYPPDTREYAKCIARSRARWDITKRASLASRVSNPGEYPARSRRALRRDLVRTAIAPKRKHQARWPAMDERGDAGERIKPGRRERVKKALFHATFGLLDGERRI